VGDVLACGAPAAGVPPGDRLGACGILRELSPAAKLGKVVPRRRGLHLVLPRHRRTSIPGRNGGRNGSYAWPITAPVIATITPAGGPGFGDLPGAPRRSRSRTQRTPTSPRPPVNAATSSGVCRAGTPTGGAGKPPPRKVAPPVIRPLESELPLPVRLPSS